MGKETTGLLIKAITVVVCCVVLATTATCQITKYAIVKMVEEGSSPREAKCAVGDSLGSDCNMYELIRHDRQK